MKRLILIAAIVASPRLASAQTDSTAAAQEVTHAAATLDSVRKVAGVREATLGDASAIYAGAVAQLDSGNYVGAQRMAEVAIRLAHGAKHGPEEIGARIDSVPFGAVPAKPGVPPIKPSVP